MHVRRTHRQHVAAARYRSILGCFLLLSASCLATSALSGCSGKGHHEREEHDAGESTEGTDASAPIVRSDAAPQAAMLSVALSAAKVQLCPGECTDLKALPDGEQSPVVLSWDQGLGGSADTQHVCPTETTSYGVTATESAGTTEFGARSATANLTITVQECKPDPRKLCESRYRYEMPADGNYLNSGKPWVIVPNWSDSGVSVTNDGGAVVIGSFGGRVQLGAQELRASSRAGVFVHKVDANCQPQWSRALSATIATDAHFAMAHATDNRGNIYVLSGGGPLVDFNPLVSYPIGFTSELLLTKLSPTGEQLLRVRFPVTATAIIASFVTDGEDSLYIAGITHAYTDLGSGPLGLSPTTLHSFLLVLDGQGRRKQLRVDASVANVAASPTRVALGKSMFAQLDFLATLAGFHPMLTPAIDVVSPSDLSTQWTVPEWRPFDLLSNGGLGSIAFSTIDRTENNRRFMGNSVDVVRVDAQGRELTRVPLSTVESETSLDGMSPIESDAGVNEDPPQLLQPPQQVRTGPADELAFSSSIYGDTLLKDQVIQHRGDKPTQDDPFGKQDLLVVKLANDDSLMWSYQPEWGQNPWVSGLDFDAQANVWLVGQGTVPGTDTSGSAARQQDLVISKLRGTR